MAFRKFLLSGLLLAGEANAQDYIHESRALRARAELYEHGRGVPQDFREAYRLYCNSAMLGDSLSAYNLGFMYFNGRGLPKKPGVAVGWFMRAAKNGDVYAARMLKRYAGIVALEDLDCQPEPPPVTVATAPGRNRIRSANRKLVEGWVGQIAPSYFVDPELVLAVIQAESGFKATALSNKNAHGLMQLIPATAQRFGVKDIWDPMENIRGGTAYLHWLLRHFAGNVEWALAAYNAGERTVEQYQGVPPYRETKNYVKRILANYPKAVHPVPPALGGPS